MGKRTHLLTHIAPINHPAHRPAQRLLNRPTQFNRQIADALRRIQHARLDKRLRRTGIKTPRAAPTSIGLERIVYLEHHVRVNFHEQRRDKKERADGRVDQHRVLAEPPEPRALREVALQNRSAIHVRSRVHRSAKLRLQPVVQRARALAQQFVVVVAARVARHRPARFAAAVLRGQHNRVRGPRVRTTRVAS